MVAVGILDPPEPPVTITTRPSRVTMVGAVDDWGVFLDSM